MLIALIVVALFIILCLGLAYQSSVTKDTNAPLGVQTSPSASLPTTPVDAIPAESVRYSSTPSALKTAIRVTCPHCNEEYSFQPETTETTGEPNRSEKSFTATQQGKHTTDTEVLVIAKHQKAIIWLILLSIPAYVASMCISFLPTIQVTPLSAPTYAASIWISFLPIIIAVISLVFIYQLAVALKESTPWLYVILGSIPCINLIALLVINARATSALKSRGIGVGLMGARQGDLDKLTTNAA